MFHSLGRYILLLRLSFRKPEKFSVYWAEVMREMVSQGIGSLGIICYYFGIYWRGGYHTGSFPINQPACAAKYCRQYFPRFDHPGV